MRGRQKSSASLFSNVSIEDRIPASHPLQRIRKLTAQAFIDSSLPSVGCTPQKADPWCRR
jgi:hypothetical protein